MFSYRVDDDIALKLLELRHATELYALVDANRACLREWLAWVDMTQNVADTQRFILYSLNNFAQHNGFQAGIWYQNRLVGVVGHASPIDWMNRAVRLGFWLSHSVWGKGIMTRACRPVIDHTLNNLQLNRIEMRCADANKKSRALARRLGFREECTLQCGQWLNGKYHDLVVYGLLARDWKNREMS